MNRWAARHLDELHAGLESGEEVRAADRVVLAKAKVETVRPSGGASDALLPRVPRSALARADSSGFPIPGTIFVLGVSNERLLFWKASKALARPVELFGGLPLEEVAAVRVVKRLWLTRVAVLLEAGPILVAKPLWGRGSHDVAAAFAEVRAG